MNQEPMGLMEFQNRFATEGSCREHLFRMRWPNGYKCPKCGHDQAYYHAARCLYHCKSCGHRASLTAGTIFHKTRVPLRKWFWMIFLMSRQKSGISMLSMQEMLEIKSYKTVWVMGHKIRKAMADRDANYKLRGLIEMDDTYFGAPKSGKRGRGAEGKAKVVVAVESKGDKAGFASMSYVEKVGRAEIKEIARSHLEQGCTVRTDGWHAYVVLDSGDSRHEPVVVRSGKRASKVLPWVHTLIANIKGNIRGVYHGVSSKHLNRYLPEFCYRFNRRFWQSQMFDRLLTACLNTNTITFGELRA
jgi:transposase-like protein